MADINVRDKSLSAIDKNDGSLVGRIQEFSKSLDLETESVQAEQLTVSPGRLGTVNALRDEFSRLEREFVELKIFIEDQSEQNTNELDSSVIQDKIKQFDSTLKVRMKTDDGKLLSQQQEIDELRTEITRLNKVNNKLQDQKACISKNLASMENSNQWLRKEHYELKNDLNELKQIVFKLREDMQDDSSSESSEESINVDKQSQNTQSELLIKKQAECDTLISANLKLKEENESLKSQQRKFEELLSELKDVRLHLQQNLSANNELPTDNRLPTSTPETANSAVTETDLGPVYMEVGDPR